MPKTKPDSANETLPETIRIDLGRTSVHMQTVSHVSDDGERILYWWSVTASAAALAKTISKMGSLNGRSVIELGCGPGLPGITAGVLGARVLFTDCVPEALQLAGDNALRNNVPGESIDFRLLDWEHPTVEERFSLILGAEILYDYYYHASLCELVDKLLLPDGEILFADRKRLAVSRFLGRMHAKGFTCSETVHSSAIPGMNPQTVSVFKVCREPRSILHAGHRT